MRRQYLLAAALGAALLGGCRDAFRTGSGTAAPAGADTAAVAGILTMDRLRMWDMAIRNLAAAAASDPSLGRLMQSRPGERPESLLARLSSSPVLTEAIGRSGLSPTQYMLVNTALFRALVTSYALEEGRLQAIPEGENAADVMFVQRNGQEIREMVARTRRELRPLVGEIGAPPADDP